MKGCLYAICYLLVWLQVQWTMHVVPTVHTGPLLPAHSALAW